MQQSEEDAPADRSVDTAGNGSRRDLAYDRIRQDIFDGTLVPGAVLSETTLSRRYGVSRTPIREALHELARVGLVRIVPQRGAFVAELAPHDIAEIYAIREQLETYAARGAARHLSNAEITSLEKEVSEAERLRGEGQYQAAFELAAGTHRRITRASRNGRLTRFLDQLDEETRRLSHLTFREPSRLEAAIGEHAQIVAALRAGDEDAAEQAMRAHLRTDRDVAIGRLSPHT